MRRCRFDGAEARCADRDRRPLDAVALKPIVASGADAAVGAGPTRRDECQAFGEPEALWARWAVPRKDLMMLALAHANRLGKFGA